MRTIKILGLLGLGALLAGPAQAERPGHRHHHDHGHAHWSHPHHRSHHHRHVWSRPQVYVRSYWGAPWHHPWAWNDFDVGWGYRSRSYGYRYDVYPAVYTDDYSYRQNSTNYTANGLLLGALAGAVIGNNSGELGNSAWRGAAYGAAGGLLLGAIADHRASKKAEEIFAAAARDSASRSISTASRAPVSSSSLPTSASFPRPVVTSPMADANRLFGR